MSSSVGFGSEVVSGIAAGIASMYSAHAPKPLSEDDEAALAADILKVLRGAVPALGLTAIDMGTYVKTPSREFEERRGLPPGPIAFDIDAGGTVLGPIQNINLR